MRQTAYYLGTVLLEANRWTAQRTPTYRVSDWLARIAAAGFDGLELWENHLALADERERAALRNSSLPVAVFNSYAKLEESGVAARSQAAGLVRDLRARAVKFNVGSSPERLDRDLRATREWAALMPGVDLLCECHPGTALEDPAVAAQALADYPEIGVIVHPFSCPDLEAWTKNLGGKIAHCHIQMLDNGRQLCRLRERSEVVRSRLALLRDCGYSGSFTIEFTAGVGAPPENRDALFAAACDDLAFLQEAR